MGVGGVGGWREVERGGETAQPRALELQHTVVCVYISQSVQFACTSSALHSSSISMKLCIHAPLYLAFLYICVRMRGVQYNPPPSAPATTSRDVQTQHHSCIPTVTLRLSRCWYPHTPPGMIYTPQLIQTEVREAGGAGVGWGGGGVTARESERERQRRDGDEEGENSGGTVLSSREQSEEEAPII